MVAVLRGWWRRLRAPGRARTAEEDSPSRPGTPGAHRPGRAHLVLRGGSVVEADLDPELHTRLEYLARRAVAPPPPEA